MNAVVVDASVALAWCFRDEASGYAEDVLVALEGKAILAPSVWGLEIANAILVGERRKRPGQPEVRRIMTLLESLPLRQDAMSASHQVEGVLELALAHGCLRTMRPISNSPFVMARPWRRSTKS